MSPKPQLSPMDAVFKPEPTHVKMKSQLAVKSDFGQDLNSETARSVRDPAMSPQHQLKAKQEDYWNAIVKQNAKLHELELKEASDRKKLL